MISRGIGRLMPTFRCLQTRQVGRCRHDVIERPSAPFWRARPLASRVRRPEPERQHQHLGPALPAPHERGVAAAARRASLRQRRAGAATDRQLARTRRAYAPQVTGPAEWRFCWSRRASARPAPSQTTPCRPQRASAGAQRRRPKSARGGTGALESNYGCSPCCIWVVLDALRGFWCKGTLTAGGLRCVCA